MQELPKICIKRILVSSKHSFAAMEAALMLAKHFEAELEGIFIEDRAVLNLAKLPFGKEVGQYTAIVRKVSSQTLESGMLMQSKWILRAFNRRLKNNSISGQFSILRGSVLEEINQKAKICDLLILGKIGHNDQLGKKFGSTATALINHSTIPILLLEEENEIGFPVIVFYQNTPEGKNCLSLAAELLSNGDSLVILLNQDNPENYQATKEELKIWAHQQKLAVTIQPYKNHRLEHILQMIQGLKTGLFILSGHGEDRDRQWISKWLERISIPILWVPKNAKFESTVNKDQDH